MCNSAGASFYYTTDALGSTILLTDSAQAATYLYDSWGNATTQTGTQANPTHGGSPAATQRRRLHDLFGYGFRRTSDLENQRRISGATRQGDLAATVAFHGFAADRLCRGPARRQPAPSYASKASAGRERGRGARPSRPGPQRSVQRTSVAVEVNGAGTAPPAGPQRSCG